jgi:hypothetical protein
MQLTRIPGLLTVCLSISFLSACGGSDDSTAPPAVMTVSGTVAAGTALTGTVSVYDSSANAQPRSSGTAIGAGGQYTVTVTGFTAPFLLQAAGQVGGAGPTVTLYSVATSAGTVNITPITTLMALNMAAGSIQTFLTGSTGKLPGLTAADLTDQNTNMDTLLSSNLTAQGLSATYNFSTTSFTTGSAGYDQLLDDVSINSTNPAAVTVTNITAPAAPITIDTADGTPSGAFDITSGPTTLPSGPSVPNVVGDTQAAAATAITAAALTVGSATTASSATVPSGDVISESPAAGTSVAGGSAVALVISSGPPTYTVGGIVIGLGSGQSVVLQDNGGDNLTVHGNGSFSFSTAIAGGGPFAATLLTQPAMQTCALQSGTGSGTVTANVTNVVVYCSYNATTATLDTTYISVGLAFDVVDSGSTTNYDYTSTDTFDGVSTISSTVNFNVAGSYYPGVSLSETYAVATPAPTAIPSYTDNSPGLGGIEGVNAAAIVAAENMTSGSEPGIYLAVLPNKNVTTASINGIYAAVDLRADGNGHFLAREGSGLTLSNGTVSGSLTTNDYPSNLSTVSVSSSYSVTTGTGLITTVGSLIPADGSSEGSFSGAISADGNLIVMADLGPGDPVTAAVFLHQGTGVTTATFNGVYNVVQYGGHSPTTPDAKAGTLFAYGNGTWSVIYTENTNQGTITTNNTGSGTYTVTADGTLTLTDAEGEVYNGAISADGNALVYGWVTSGLAPEIGVGVRQ